MPRTASAQTIQNKVEEEREWAEIYKNNNEVYKNLDTVQKIRQAEEKKKFKKDLDLLVSERNERKKLLEEEKKVDLHQVISRVQLEEEKERKRIVEAKAKIKYEKEMRDKQLKEILYARKQEAKEQRRIDRFIVQKIREE